MEKNLKNSFPIMEKNLKKYIYVCVCVYERVHVHM